MSTAYAYADDFRMGLQFGKMRDPEYYPSSPEVLQSMLKGKLKQHTDHIDGHGGGSAHNRNVRKAACETKSDLSGKKRNTKARTSKPVPNSVQASAASTSTPFPRSTRDSLVPRPNTPRSNLKHRHRYSEQPRSIPKSPQLQTPRTTPNKAKDFRCNSVQQRSIRKWLQVLRIPIGKVEAEADGSSPLCDGSAISHLVRFYQTSKLIFAELTSRYCAQLWFRFP